MLKTTGETTMDHILLSDSDTDSDRLREPTWAKIRIEKAKRKRMRKKAKKYQKKMKRLEIPKIVKADEPVMYMNWKGVGRRLKQKYNQPLHYLTVSLLIKWDEWKTVGDFEGTMEPYNAESVVLGLEQVHRKFACPKHLAKLWIDSPSYQDLIDNKI